MNPDLKADLKDAFIILGVIGSTIAAAIYLL